MFDAARENDMAKRPEWYQTVLKEIEALEHPKPRDSEGLDPVFITHASAG